MQFSSIIAAAHLDKNAATVHNKYLNINMTFLICYTMGHFYFALTERRIFVALQQKLVYT